MILKTRPISAKANFDVRTSRRLIQEFLIERSLVFRSPVLRANPCDIGKGVVRLKTGLAHAVRHWIGVTTKSKVSSVS